MPDLVISRVEPGVATARSTDPFTQLVVHRLDRARWRKTPAVPGVYLLYGVSPDGKLTVYVGMSTSSMRARIASHHVDSKKNWFGTLFAVPVPHPLLVPAIEAELIAQVSEAGVVDVIANVKTESHHRGSEDVHVAPAVDRIRDALELMLGSDVFSPAEAPDAGETAVAMDAPAPRAKAMVRQYVDAAAALRDRTDEDPADARHWFVRPEIGAWGRFEADDPDKRFRVLAGSRWRRATANPEHTSYASEQRIVDLQDELVESGVLDEAEQTFRTDHVFDNWRDATLVVGGKNYSGSHHWQRLSGPADGQ